MLVALGLTACRRDQEPPPIDLGPDIVDVTVNERMVLERRFAILLVDGADATLRCTTDADPLEDHRLRLVGAGELRLHGLLAETSYDCALTDDGGALRWSGTFTTDPLPLGLPNLVASGDRALAASDDGYTLFVHWPLGRRGPSVKRVVVVDGDGRVRWYLDVDDARTGGIAASILPADHPGMVPGGRLVTGGGQSSPPAIRDLSGEVLYQVPPAIQADPGYHHEALLSPEGWLVSLQSVENTGGDVPFNGFRIEAWDPATDTRVWSFDTQPWVDAGVLPPGGSTTGRDPYHANAITFVDDDPGGPAVWVSLRGLGTLMRIDRDTAEVTGFFGPDQGITLLRRNGRPAPAADWFWGQHAPEIVRDTFLVYDNGGRRPGRGKYSRVAKYRQTAPDEAVLLWDWTEPGWYEVNFGSVLTVPNTDGHVLVGTGHCSDCPPEGDTAWILELDPTSGQVVWRFDFASDRHSLYRAQPVPGCDLFANVRTCPALGDEG